MRIAAKWVAIVRSIFCLGMFIWVVAWAAVAGPALAVYSVSGKKNDTKQVVIHQQASLCNECGKYYEGQTDFCPHCGKPTKTT